MDANITNEEYEQKLREYYRNCFISEFSKIIIFFLAFFCLGLTKEYITALFFLMLFRKNGGGLHYNHYISCLLVSFFFLFTAIFLSLHITLSQWILYSSTLLFVILGYLLVPVTSKNRPPASPEQIKKSKQSTAFLIAAFCLLIVVLPHNTFLYIGYWTLVLHIVQLLIARIQKRR